MYGGRFAAILMLAVATYCSFGIKHVEAIRVISGETGPAVAAETVVDDDLVIYGNDVVVDGTVNGDVFIFAQRAAVRGNIQGDLVAAVQSIDVDGNIAEDARIAAQNIRVNGKIMRNFWAAAQEVIIGRDGDVGHNASVASQSMTLGGAIRGELNGTLESLYIPGILGGTGKIHARDIRIGPAGKIGADLFYTSPNEVVVEPGGQISGLAERTEPSPGPEREVHKKRSQRGWIWSSLLGFLAGLVVWAVWKHLLPDSWYTWQRSISDDPLKSAVIGVILIGGIPVLSLLILITLIGIPLALMLMVIYGFIYYLSHLVVGGVLGAYLYKRLRWRENNWMFPLGYLVITLLSAIPLVGFFTRVIVFALGLGALCIKFLSGKQA